ncbi:ATP-dependent helicase [Yunchengibacter salinarum]|uniref:ATP-dependent helicase n=1 Tax=Yunchengibacter salinarum TaxID=3133399 RepID=UPI0035B573ED
MSDDPFDMSDLDSPPPPATEPPYLTGLNAQQREAVLSTDGPLLVLAGAGTGKTRVLTTRLAHILRQGLARPQEVLAVTFTNKAAGEMKRRVEQSLGRPVEGMWIGTFHALCARILRAHAELAGLRHDFTILDTDDQIRLLKQLLAAEGLDSKRWPARQLAGLIDRWKNRAITPDTVPASESHAFADGRGVALYRAYQDRLKVLNAVDFGDLLLHVITLFQTHDDVLGRYQDRFRYILVDEYQDTNVAQYLWLRLLARRTGSGEARNICCVGDDDQSIYGWRGAEVGNILRFAQDFPGAKTVRLEQNYRSTGHILAAASAVIAGNEGRLGKTLWTEDGDGERVQIHGVWDAHEEARSIGHMLEEMERGGATLNDVAVLVRASFQMREVEERLIQIGLPYRVIGGPRFYERREIRDALAYFRLIMQEDDDLAFERIINVPKRGIGATSLQRLHKLARAHGVSMTRAARQLATLDELRPQTRKSLNAFLEDLDRWRALLHTHTHSELAEVVLEESGYSAMWQKDTAPDAKGRLENLKELVAAMGEFDSLAGFLEHIQLVMENEENATADKVNLMTLHGAKGLEFHTVFLPGWEETVFPNQRALDESGTAGLEEERRLAYVALTRARRQAHVFFAANRQVFGQWQNNLPSRFIDELPGEHVSMNAASGVYGNTAPRIEEADAFGGIDNLVRGGGSKYGPGWQRAERRAARARPVTPRAPKRESISTLAVGERVFHDKFGYGEVIDVAGHKLLISFDKSGEKRVMDSFVRPADEA